MKNITKKELNFCLDKMSMEDFYKFILNKIPIHKNFEGKKRQIVFDLGKYGQIVFTKENGEVVDYFYSPNGIKLKMYPNLEYKHNISIQANE